MINNTPLLNINGKAQFGCHASLPGTGPSGEICSHCTQLAPDGSRFVCDKYRVMTGRKGKPISPSSSACRYFVKRPAFNSNKGAV